MEFYEVIALTYLFRNFDNYHRFFLSPLHV